MVCSLIALGGNLGASPSLFTQAMKRLERPGISLIRLSRPLSSSAMGADAGEEFLNAAATVECQLSPIQLLAALHEVEASFGRTRNIRWGPRTLDLDLCLFGDEIIDRPELVVPHPAMWYRHFVMTPAAEVSPHLLHPILQQSVLELHQQLCVQPLEILVRRYGLNGRDSKLAEWITRLVPSPVVRWHVGEITRRTEPGEHPQQIFAEVVLDGLVEADKSQSGETQRSRSQPQNELTRTIRMRVADAEDDVHVLERLQEIVAAVGG